MNFLKASPHIFKLDFLFRLNKYNIYSVIHLQQIQLYFIGKLSFFFILHLYIKNILFPELLENFVESVKCKVYSYVHLICSSTFKSNLNFISCTWMFRMFNLTECNLITSIASTNFLLFYIFRMIINLTTDLKV